MLNWIIQSYIHNNLYRSTAKNTKHKFYFVCQWPWNACSHNNGNHSKHDEYVGTISYSIEQSTPPCNTSGEVALLDIDTGENTHLQGSNVTVEGNVISFKLPTNRHYNITVIAFNNAGSSISYTTLSESHVLLYLLMCLLKLL